MVAPLLIGGLGLLGSGVTGRLVGGRSRRKAKSYQKAAIQAAHRRAIQERDQFSENAVAEEGEARQNYYARGLGDSSIREQGEGRLKRAHARALQSLEDQINVSKKRKKAFKAQSKYDKFMDFWDILQGTAGAAGASFDYMNRMQ